MLFSVGGLCCLQTKNAKSAAPAADFATRKRRGKMKNEEIDSCTFILSFICEEKKHINIKIV